MSDGLEEQDVVERFCTLYSDQPEQAMNLLVDLDELVRIGVLIDAGGELSEIALIDTALSELSTIEPIDQDETKIQYFIGNARQHKASILTTLQCRFDLAVIEENFLARVAFAKSIESRKYSVEYKTQAATNIGNLLWSSGRWVEALDFYLEAQQIFSRNGVAALREMESLMGLYNMILDGDGRFHSYAEMSELKQRIAALAEIVTQTYDVIEAFAGEQAVLRARDMVNIAPAKKEACAPPVSEPYLKFVKAENLALSVYCSDKEYNSQEIDTVKFPSITTGFAQPDVPELFAMLNVIKTDFALARQLYYQTYQLDCSDTFFETVSLNDTANSADYGVRISALTTSQRLAVDILDKISVAVSDYYQLKQPKKSTFHSVWTEEIKGEKCPKCSKRSNKTQFNANMRAEIENGNSGLLALYELQKDMTAEHPDKVGFLRSMRAFRIASTHRFTVLHGEMFGLRSNSSNLIDHAGMAEFTKLTLATLKTTRAAIFYFCDAINQTEKQRDKDIEKKSIPMLVARYKFPNS